MVWIEKWRAIAARIDGLMSAAEFLAQMFQQRDSDAYGSAKRLLEEHGAILKELEAFDLTYGDLLPMDAQVALTEALHITIPKPSSEGGRIAAIAVIAQIAAFKSRFQYFISDMEIETQNATELSFEHLNRTIVVDDLARDRWNEAFTHETKCEQLGAVHLLGHGIWAFKVLAIGGATDLVYGEPVAVARAARVARALVHTEWKRVLEPADAARVATAAIEQSELYQSGVLGDLELKRVRYVVLVSKEPLPPIADVSKGNVIYRHINIVISPASPSAIAQRLARQTKPKKAG